MISTGRFKALRLPVFSSREHDDSLILVRQTFDDTGRIERPHPRSLGTKRKATAKTRDLILQNGKAQSLADPGGQEC
jgi:hypothetical protein